MVVAARTGENSDTAELALEILITLALRNRDRVSLIWPLIHEYIAACTAAESSEQATPLVARAVAGLFRVCQRLLPYKEDTAEMLLSSLKLVQDVAPGAAWQLSERIAADVAALLKSSAPYIRTEADWRTICGLIRLSSANPEAVPLVYEALSVACRDSSALSGESYMPLLETCLNLIDKYKGSHTEAAARFLDCADALFGWLPGQGGGGGNHGNQNHHSGDDNNNNNDSDNTVLMVLSDETLLGLWLASVGIMAHGLCRADSRHLRDTSITTLHRTLIASAPLNLPMEVWVQTTRELLIPMVSDLAKLAATPKTAKSRPGLEKSVRLSVNMLTKVLLQYIPVICEDRDFYALWDAALTSLQTCMTIRQEAIMEAVPEAAKNMLLVLASSDVLVPGWNDAQGRSLWELTWAKSAGISSGLNPGMLQAAGIGGGLVEQQQQVAVVAVVDSLQPPLPSSSSGGGGGAVVVGGVDGADGVAVEKVAEDAAAAETKALLHKELSFDGHVGEIATGGVDKKVVEVVEKVKGEAAAVVVAEEPPACKQS